MSKKGITGLSAAGGIIFILGIVSVCYYGAIMIYAGFRSSFAWFWLALGAAFIGVSVFLRLASRGKLHIPRALMVTGITLAVAGAAVFIIVEGIIITNGNRQAAPGADYIIVLGAQVRGTRVSRTLKSRLDTAAAYLKDNAGTVAIVSGGRGSGEEITEARAMKDYLLGQGIDGTRIIEEDKSTNTSENILFSKRYIEGQNKRIIIVTSSFHVYRGTAIAKKQDIGIIEGLGAPSDDILMISYYVREALAVMKDILMGNI